MKMPRIRSTLAAMIAAAVATSATLLWEQLSRANREAIQPLSNSAVFSRQFIISSVGSSPSVSLPGRQ